MLRLSKLADYGTLVMVYIAQNAKHLHNARDIALHTRISLPTVSKLLKLLTREGLLKSRRGTKGGYSLTNIPKNISVADILRAIDGEFAMTECTHEGSNCLLEPYCSTRSNWRLISQAIEQALTCVTLADMAKPFAHKKLVINNQLLMQAALRKV